MTSSGVPPDCEHVETCVGPVRGFLKSLRGSNNNNEESVSKCDDCGSRGSNIWLCLYPSCLALLCSKLPDEDGEDHSLIHLEDNPCHALQLNLRSRKIWCFECQREVKNDLLSRGEASSSAVSLGQKASSGGLVGLANLGNTCYMNAALQCLSNTPSLSDYFMTCFYPLSGPGMGGGKPLAKAYGSLLLDMWTKKRRNNYAVPSGVVRAIKAAHPIFQGYLQQDAQEFLRCFMDTLHEELSEAFEAEEEPEEENDSEDNGSSSEESEMGDYETADSGLSEDSCSRGSPEDSRLKSLLPYGSNLSGSHRPPPKKQKKVYRSIISDVFDGKLISTVQCLTCNRISTTEETFQDLSLPIPNQESLSSTASSNHSSSSSGWLAWMWSYFLGFLSGPKVSLGDCLSYFFSADELKGDNMYSCGKCKKLRNGLKYSKVTILPECLCIHLKRFRHEFAYSSKISSRVTFPLLDLDLSPWTHKDFGDKETLYELSGLIVHSGTASGEWYEYDDSVVTRVDPSFVLGLEAYVLFYRKSNDRMDTIRDQIQSVLVRCQQAQESSLMQFYVSKDFLCHHGEVQPLKYGLISQLTIPLPQILWERLHKTFGGASPVTRLMECGVCKAEAASLARQKAYESNEFQRLYTEFTWEDFVQGRQSDPPGPINNRVLTSNPRGGPPTYSPSSEDLSVSASIWNFFLSNYGGGPEIYPSGSSFVVCNPKRSLEHESN
ncbi:Ubiquitinyl hydrolase 1 [Caligus rogercresseyi]|uniref:ubiquitinyl hydrolase 1 n=1 Tax=Caligus rogercresseyi TaxID=217165 RepID=A0A7T8GNW8_CALRO|nr:Ubiquitinyl hydrolase 1 [Caligus rogercresseyi]